MAIDDKVAFVMMKLANLSVQKDREAYLRGLIDLCAQATEAERSTVYFVDQGKKELWSRVAARTAQSVGPVLGQIPPEGPAGAGCPSIAGRPSGAPRSSGGGMHARPASAATPSAARVPAGATSTRSSTSPGGS